MKDFHKQIKHTLEEREIQPSQDSWMKIEKELKEEPKSTYIWWRSVAVVFIFSAVVALFFILIPSENTVDSTIKESNSFSVKPFEIEEESVQENAQPIIDIDKKVSTNPKNVMANREEITSKATAKDVENENNNTLVLDELTPPTIVPKPVNAPTNAEDKLEKTNNITSVKPVKKRDYRAKVDPEKLRFFVENEKELNQIKSKPKVAFENSSLSFDISED